MNPSYLLKVTKFLLNISQFGFLVTTEQSVLVYKLFLLLNIPYFSLFLLKNCNPPPDKSYPLFLSNSPLKSEALSSSPLWKFGRRLNHLQQKAGVHTLSLYIYLCIYKDINIQCLCKIYCKELEQYLMQFDALEKKRNETTNYSI